MSHAARKHKSIPAGKWIPSGKVGGAIITTMRTVMMVMMMMMRLQKVSRTKTCESGHLLTKDKPSTDGFQLHWGGVGKEHLMVLINQIV